jgi:hypothetical protein
MFAHAESLPKKERSDDRSRGGADANHVLVQVAERGSSDAYPIAQIASSRRDRLNSLPLSGLN